jgi:uncharacterized peroxidase-related enzyme
MKPISRFPIGSLDSLPDDVAGRIKQIADKTGFVPNVFLALGHRPDELAAFMDYHDAVMERETGLSKADRELIVVATSAANDCQYCVIAHGAIARLRTKDPYLADQVAINWRKADLSDRQRAMIAFAVKLAVAPGEVGATDIEALREQGFDDDDIWDIGAVTAFFALSNRLANLLDLRPNDEFYVMGRAPRERTQDQ